MFRGVETDRERMSKTGCTDDHDDGRDWEQRVSFLYNSNSILANTLKLTLKFIGQGEEITHRHNLKIAGECCISHAYLLVLVETSTTNVCYKTHLTSSESTVQTKKLGTQVNKPIFSGYSNLLSKSG